jgi:hypothetical protein
MCLLFCKLLFYTKRLRLASNINYWTTLLTRPAIAVAFWAAAFTFLDSVTQDLLGIFLNPIKQNVLR